MWNVLIHMKSIQRRSVGLGGSVFFFISCIDTITWFRWNIAQHYTLKSIFNWEIFRIRIVSFALLNSWKEKQTDIDECWIWQRRKDSCANFVEISCIAIFNKTTNFLACAQLFYWHWRVSNLENIAIKSQNFHFSQRNQTVVVLTYQLTLSH